MTATVKDRDAKSRTEQRKKKVRVLRYDEEGENERARASVIISLHPQAQSRLPTSLIPLTQISPALNCCLDKRLHCW